MYMNQELVARKASKAIACPRGKKLAWTSVSSSGAVNSLVAREQLPAHARFTASTFVSPHLLRRVAASSPSNPGQIDCTFCSCAPPRQPRLLGQ
mmetsp:Transcript_37180/g.118503  ORF Transcript_37180/g.118503 Transcript_37180/m.118503 type:complete len:94 (+) Transcript_37180:129-410(+)|eukprot:scaffold2722_cov197-Isochrysis_galbana.AAC.1